MSVGMWQEMSVTASDRLWAEALNYACDVSHLGVPLSLKGGTAPYEPWHGTLNGLAPSGTHKR